MDYEIVDVIITSRFGGVSSCDTFIRGLAQCLQQRRKKKRSVPIYGRMVGTDLPRAREFLEQVRRQRSEDFKDVEIIELKNIAFRINDLAGNQATSEIRQLKMDIIKPISNIINTDDLDDKKINDEVVVYAEAKYDESGIKPNDSAKR